MARSLTIKHEENARISGLFAAFVSFGILWMLLTGWSTDVSASTAVDAPNDASGMTLQ